MNFMGFCFLDVFYTRCDKKTIRAGFIYINIYFDKYQTSKVKISIMYLKAVFFS